MHSYQCYHDCYVQRQAQICSHAVNGLALHHSGGKLWLDDDHGGSTCITIGLAQPAGQQPRPGLNTQMAKANRNASTLRH